MNWLQLSQRLALEAGISGTLATTTGQIGSLGRAVAWTNQAWMDIQTMRDDWNWMRSSVLLGAGASFPTVAGRATYPLGIGPNTCGITADNFGKWDRYAFRNYTTTVGFRDEIRMGWVAYDDWREAYMYGAQQATKTRPMAVAIGPDKSVCVGPPSNGLYTVTGDYWIAPSLMANDNATPTGLPQQFHMLIVWKALLDYGGFEAAPEAIARAELRWGTLSRQLLLNSATEITLGGALA